MKKRNHRRKPPVMAEPKIARQEVLETDAAEYRKPSIRIPDRNPTFATVGEYLANREHILEYALGVIRRIDANPPLQRQDWEDIQSYVDERCWRYPHRIPSGSGQKSWIFKLVLHGLYELRAWLRRYVVLVLADGVALTDLLTKSKARHLIRVKKGFWARHNAFEGRVSTDSLIELFEDDRVLRLIFVFEGLVQPALLTDENEEVAVNLIEALASVDPFRRVCMRLDEETAREKLAETNSIGAEVFQLNVRQGLSFRKISEQGKYSSTFYRNCLWDYRREFRDRFPELGSYSA